MKKRFSTAVFAAILAFLLALNLVAVAENSGQDVRVYGSLKDYMDEMQEEPDSAKDFKDEMQEKVDSVKDYKNRIQNRIQKTDDADVYFSGLTREEIIDRLREIPKYTTVKISEPIEMEENITGYSMTCGQTGFGIMFKPDVTNDGATIVLFPLEAESISEVDYDDWFNALSFMIQAVDDELTLYADYECALRLDNHVPMAYKNLQSVLQIGRTAVNDFWREVSPVYVIEKDGALFLTDRAAFHRGKLIDTDRRWMKIYDNSVRALYRAADRSKHKHLGHVFKMLRYINVQHNILCRNPMEKDREHIVPITFGQFCELAGYDTSQCSRLISYFMGIKFRVGDHEEHFCKFVTNRKCLSYSWIFINPNVLYSGTDPESVGNFAVLSRSPDSDGLTQE